MMLYTMFPLLVFSSACTQLDAFSNPSNPMRLSSHLCISKEVSSDDSIRQDIQAMREEAIVRLEVLNEQMEALMKEHEGKEKSIKSTAVSVPKEISKTTSTASIEVVKIPEPSQRSRAEIDNIPSKSIVDLKQKKEKEETEVKETDIRLLEGTRWKVVIRVGRPPLTSMELKPLLIHLVVDFEEGQLHEADSLLHGIADARVLKVKESWVAAGSMTEGRQHNVKIDPLGGWKVLRGQGPRGIDVLRFFIDVQEEISHGGGLLTCPADRIYGTCGYFCMEKHREAEIHKEKLRRDIDDLILEHESLTLKDQCDERLISWEKLQRAKRLIDVNLEIKQANNELQEARARDPEKGSLRLSRKGDVGVTKEGQICRKLGSGLSVEYEILGKMEMASTNKRSEDMDGFHP